MRTRLYAALALLFLTSSAGAQSSIDAMTAGNATVAKFSKGGTRQELLDACKAALAAGMAGPHEAEFRSLVDALEHAPPPPPGYDKPPASRTAEESIRAAIYDLDGDLPFGPDFVAPGDRLIAAGTAALEPLIEALDDATPSHTIGMEACISRSVLLRREDLALHCIEQITGVQLFNRTQGRGGQFHNDPHRAEFLEKIHAWWKLARGKSQADILRLEIERSGPSEALVLRIAELEGPESVLNPLRELLARPGDSPTSPIALSVARLDPQPVLRAALQRFRDGKAVPLDYSLLVRFGDKKIYRELAARAQTDPAPWGGTDLSFDVARQGRNWGIPLLAVMLTHTEMQSYGPNRRLSPADFAMQPFQSLAGREFGYNFEGTEAERLAAIKRASDWWLAEGRTALAVKIEEDHNDPASDLFESDDQLAASAAAIASPDAATARAAVAALPQSYSAKVQRALLARISREPLAAERAAILARLGTIAPWHAPALAEIFEHDPDTTVRAAAATLLGTLDGPKVLSPYQSMLAATRRVVDDPKTPAPLLPPAALILIKADSSLDDARLRRLQPALHLDDTLDRYFKSLEARRHPEYPML